MLFLEKMAAVFPRTCYKCGEAGHVADDCTQEERLCYNCRKPGHESGDCPEPKQTTSKQCYSCGDVGHIQTECPNQAQGAKCYNCGQFGHISKNCDQAPTGQAPPFKKSYGPRGGFCFRNHLLQMWWSKPFC